MQVYHHGGEVANNPIELVERGSKRAWLYIKTKKYNALSRHYFEG